MSTVFEDTLQPMDATMTTTKEAEPRNSYILVLHLQASLVQQLRFMISIFSV